jgi:hypothetical protein
MLVKTRANSDKDTKVKAVPELLDTFTNITNIQPEFFTKRNLLPPKVATHSIPSIYISTLQLICGYG